VLAVCVLELVFLVLWGALLGFIFLFSDVVFYVAIHNMVHQGALVRQEQARYVQSLRMEHFTFLLGDIGALLLHEEAHFGANAEVRDGHQHDLF